MFIFELTIRGKRVGSLGLAENCESLCSCSAIEEDDLLGYAKNILNSEECKKLCTLNSGCNYYTYFNDRTGNLTNYENHLNNNVDNVKYYFQLKPNHKIEVPRRSLL